MSQSLKASMMTYRCWLTAAHSPAYCQRSSSVVYLFRLHVSLYSFGNITAVHFCRRLGTRRTCPHAAFVGFPVAGHLPSVFFLSASQCTTGLALVAVLGPLCDLVHAPSCSAFLHSSARTPLMRSSCCRSLSNADYMWAKAPSRSSRFCCAGLAPSWSLVVGASQLSAGLTIPIANSTRSVALLGGSVVRQLWKV